MREIGSVNMVSRVMGVGGQLGKGTEQAKNLEILSVGPQYREVDYRELYLLMKKPPFLKQVPL